MGRFALWKVAIETATNACRACYHRHRKKLATAESIFIRFHRSASISQRS